MLELVTAPSDVLSQKAQPVLKIDRDIAHLIDEMKQTLLAITHIVGVGLAAPQVGKSLRIFIMKPTEKSQIKTIINPVMVASDPIPKKQKKEDGNIKLEGCLSLTDIWGTVIRSPKITITYLDENGKGHTTTFKGFPATVIQHEMDHLEGILFPKRVLEQKGTLYQSHKNEKGEDIFDEITI